MELDDAAKAEKLIRNLAQRLERDAPGVSKSILEGLDEILTVSRLGLPAELRRSLACTNIIENMMGTVRRVTRNVKRWSSPSMALRWTAAAMHEAKKGFRRLKAFRQLPVLRAALAAHYKRKQTVTQLLKTRRPLNVIHGSARFAKFNRARGNSDRSRECRFHEPFDRTPDQRCAAVPIHAPAQPGEGRMAGRPHNGSTRELRERLAHFPRDKTA